MSPFPLALLLLASDTSGCTSNPQVTASVAAAYQAAPLRSDFSTRELEELRTRSGKSAQRRTLGFYSQQFGYTIDVKSAQDGNSACPQTLVVRVVMGLFERQIQLARDLPRDSCLYDASLKHYGRHAWAAEQTLLRYVHEVKTALQSAKLSAQLNSPAEVVWSDQLKKAVRATVDQALETYDKSFADAQNAVETPDEINRLNGGCTAEL